MNDDVVDRFAHWEHSECQTTAHEWTIHRTSGEIVARFIAASQPPSGDARCPDCGHPSDAHRYEDGCAWLYNSDLRERCGCDHASQPPSGDALRADVHNIQHQHRDGTWWYCAATPAPLDTSPPARDVALGGDDDAEQKAAAGLRTVRLADDGFRYITTATPAPLDVERLARVLERHHKIREGHADLACGDVECAEDIARQYVEENQ